MVPTNGRLGSELTYIRKPSDAPDDFFEPPLTNISGSNYFDRQQSSLFLVVRGPDPVEIRVVPVVMVTCILLLLFLFVFSFPLTLPA